MFFNTKRNPRKTTRQTLSTEQLEQKAMFSVSPVEPVVALDVGPVNQTGYEFQAKDVASVKTYCTGYCFADTDGFMKIGDIPTESGLRAHPGGTGSKFGDIPTESGLRAHPGGTGSKFGDIMGEVGGVFASPHGTYFEGSHDPQLQREGVANPLDQMGFTKTIRDVDIASESLGGSAGPGGDDIFMPKPNRAIVGGGKGNGYAEAVGLDSSIVGGGKGNGYAEAVGLDSSTVVTSSSDSYTEVEWTYFAARQEVFARMGR